MLIFIFIQWWICSNAALLTRSQCRVSDNQVAVKDRGLLVLKYPKKKFKVGYSDLFCWIEPAEIERYSFFTMFRIPKRQWILFLWIINWGNINYWINLFWNISFNRDTKITTDSQPSLRTVYLRYEVFVVRSGTKSASCRK